MERVLQKMRKKGIDQLLVSDPLSIRFLTGITVNPGERLYALLLRTSGKHTIFLNYLFPIQALKKYGSAIWTIRLVF